MSPIEEHLVAGVMRDLGALGLANATVQVLSAEAEDWRYRITVRERQFELGFNHRDRLWVREMTPGREKHLVSNDHRPVNASPQARGLGLRLIARAVTHPDFPPRDPPIL